MDARNSEKQREPEEPRYLSFKNSQPGSGLNKFSSTLTRKHDFPAAQAMLRAAGLNNDHDLKNLPQIGIAACYYGGMCQP